jgi:hypothetical protein
MVYLRLTIILGVLAAAVVSGGCCVAPVRFPEKPLTEEQTASGLVRAYDTTGDGRADYFTSEDASGRIIRIGYDTKGEGAPTEWVDLDAIPVAGARHIILIVDGIGDVAVEAMRKEGRLRLFYPPSRLISPFPPMTDLALTDAFRSAACASYEVIYYDREKKSLVGGSADYMNFMNQSWVNHLNYRGLAIMDLLSYLYPGWSFETELSTFRMALARSDRDDMTAYFVSTAGLGTRLGMAGQRRVLETIDRLTEELVQKTRGRVKVTMMSDHGHTLTACERVDFRPYLKERGWRPADRLEKPRDVAVIEFGIITYAAFATDDRPGLAAILVEHPGVDLVTYPDGERVAVEKKGERAYVERRGDRYRYVAAAGDPLDLAPIIEKMKAEKAIDADGFADDRAWFERTLTHKYPDPLNRLWRAFNGMVTYAPDVVASMKEAYCTGAMSRSVWVPKISSTHGDLEQKSSTAFIMSTIGPVLPPGVGARHRDLAPIMEKLTARPWPPQGEGKDK